MNKFTVKKTGGLLLAAVMVFNIMISINDSTVEAAVSASRAKEIRAQLYTLVEMVNENYYKKVDTEKMLNEVIEEATDDMDIDKISKLFISKLNDPYSEYYTAEELESFNSSMKGEYYGIGVEIAKDSKTGGIKINRVFPNSPAEKAKLKKGDIILMIGNEDITKLELKDASPKIKGEKGTKITLTVLRDKKKKRFEVERNEVIMPTVFSKTYNKGKIGYISVTNFLENTDEEFISALDKLESKGIEGVIIDLRDNGGGYVDTAFNMVNRILPSGEDVFSFGYGNGRREHYKTEDKAGEKDKTFDLPITVIINKNSASSSEIFTGALRDNYYADILGETSFGKGVSQSIIRMQNLLTGKTVGGVKLTTTKYYLPKGESIDKIGITPEIMVENDKNTVKDEQLEKAIQEMKKKMD